MTKTIAYLNSRFPSTSQTFVLNELLQLKEFGWDVEHYPMVREAQAISHPGVHVISTYTHFFRVPSRRCLRAHIYWARKRPLTLIRALILSLTLPGWKKGFHLKSIWATLWAVMVAADVERRSIRHVHAHWATFPAHAAMVVARLTGCTFSFTAHAHDIYANSYGLEEKISSAAFVATISDLNRGILMSATHGAGRIEVVRCGVDLSQFPYRGTKVPNAPFRVVAVGSLEEKKGQRYLIEACSLLQSQGREIDCRIIGEGQERSNLERLIHELQLEGSVTLLGALNSTQVAAELSEADAFVMPSVVASNGMMEGIPVALMEAMAVGLPVIASEISGIPELVEDNKSGMLVAQRDPDSIATAVGLLIEKPDLRASLGVGARNIIAERYNLITNTRQLSDLFESVVANAIA
jgi:colanic acid/amylovoran biosynthesis glycosyltransferase